MPGLAPGKKFASEPIIVRFPGCQREPDRQAIGIDHRMNFAGQPAPWPAHGLPSVPSDAGTVLMHADDNRCVDHHGPSPGFNRTYRAGLRSLSTQKRTTSAQSDDFV
jgi:hypothetical protein